tara:strand:- start:222 stop:596 length:375 start_codon:yes stop_codon:yes gene_type:complete
MPLATLIFDEPLNSSLQLGDIVYYSPTNQAANSNIWKATTTNVVKFGVVNNIIVDPPSVKVIYDAGVSLPSYNPLHPDYIMFEKDKQVNSSSLIGYYANVKLVNDSKGKIELFSLGSEVSESSK